MAGIREMAWQLHVAEIMTATLRNRWLYPEVCAVVARQNGKTTLLIPRIVMGLLAGERITHFAQDRELPRDTHRQVAAVMVEHCRPLLESMPRYANGQEEIRTKSGGLYKIGASRTSGPRGRPNDLVIIDEARELDTFHFIAAARPTLTASKNPQMIYLSNAGHDESVVLNALRNRAGDDPSLGYIEWSAAPDRAVDDRVGWQEANPALGVTITWENLEQDFRSMPNAEFETEHLCRWVRTMAPRVVSDIDWQRAAAQSTGVPQRAFMGVAVAGDRASVAIAWQADDGTVQLTIPFDAWGRPLDVDGLGQLVHAEALRLGIGQIGYNPATDRDLIRHLWGRPIGAQEFAAASERFARTVEGGRLRHFEADVVGSDLAFTGRVQHGTTWHAEPSNPERPVTAALAAIRAVWLATEPAPEVGLL